jgi:hypothetical protein
VSGAETRKVSYGYNDANQRTAMTALNRPAVNYGYNTAGRLSTITQGEPADNVDSNTTHCLGD